MKLEYPTSPEEYTAARVMLEIARLAFFDAAVLVDECGRLKSIDKMDEDTVADISAIEIETVDGESRVVSIALHDKVGALELLLRHCEKHEPDSIQSIDETARDYLQREVEKAKRGGVH